jgi:hypothetical protein
MSTSTMPGPILFKDSTKPGYFRAFTRLPKTNFGNGLLLFAPVFIIGRAGILYSGGTILLPARYYLFPENSLDASLKVYIPNESDKEYFLLFAELILVEYRKLIWL